MNALRRSLCENGETQQRVCGKRENHRRLDEAVASMDNAFPDIIPKSIDLVTDVTKHSKCLRAVLRGYPILVRQQAFPGLFKMAEALTCFAGLRFVQCRYCAVQPFE